MTYNVFGGTLNLTQSINLQGMGAGVTAGKSSPTLQADIVLVCCSQVTKSLYYAPYSCYDFSYLKNL